MSITLTIKAKPTDDSGNGIKVTGARGCLSHLSQSPDLGLAEVQHVEAIGAPAYNRVLSIRVKSTARIT